MQEIFLKFFCQTGKFRILEELAFCIRICYNEATTIRVYPALLSFFEKNVVFQKITLRRVLHVTLRDVV